MTEYHPYGEFFPKNARAMIVGSFPIGKFSDPRRRSEIKAHEYDFFFGGEKNLLWRLLAQVFHRELRTVDDIKALLEEQGLAIGDVVKSCRRKSGGGSDSDLYSIEWNEELLQKIKEQGIKKVLFTSKKVEIWFKRLFPEAGDLVQVTLISPSGQSVRSLGRRPDYQQWAKKHQEASKFDFILEFYRQAFTNLNST